jgi:hypothetical protein
VRFRDMHRPFQVAQVVDLQGILLDDRGDRLFKGSRSVKPRSPTALVEVMAVVLHCHTCVPARFGPTQSAFLVG